jgi:hypothetical protein
MDVVMDVVIDGDVTGLPDEEARKSHAEGS